MTTNKPIMDSGYAPMMIRIILSLYFLVVGYVTLNNQHLFIQAVEQLQAYPYRFTTLYAAILPYLELGAGILLFIGLWTNIAAIIACVVIVSFILSIGFFPYEGLPELFNKDIIFLIAAFSLMASGPGKFSFDNQKE